MKTWNLIIALTLGLAVVESARTQELLPVAGSGQACQKPGCGAKKCYASSIWDVLCYRSMPIPKECRTCLSPSRSCTPPLYHYFLSRYPTFNNEATILRVPDNGDHQY